MNTYAAYHVMWGGLDPMGMATECCLYVRRVPAFGIEGFQLFGWQIGPAHLALQLERDGEPTLIELQPYVDDNHSEDNRIASGPLMTYRYLRTATQLQEQGFLDSEEMLNMIDENAKKGGFKSADDLLESLDKGLQNLTGGSGLRNWYGLYLSPGLDGRGEKFEIKLAGDACAKLDEVEAAARSIAAASKEPRFTIIPKNHYFEFPLGDGKKMVMISKGPTEMSLGGFGYDFTHRNSNSFIGSILRMVNLEAPAKSTAGAIGYSHDWTAWTPSDVWWQDRFRAGIAANLNVRPKQPEQ